MTVCGDPTCIDAMMETPCVRATQNVTLRQDITWDGGKRCENVVRQFFPFPRMCCAGQQKSQPKTLVLNPRAAHLIGKNVNSIEMSLGGLETVLKKNGQ